MDNSIFARIRRKLPGFQDSQRVDDLRSIQSENLGASADTILRKYHEMTDEQLQKRADESHAEHRDATGNVPKD